MSARQTGGAHVRGSRATAEWSGFARWAVLLGLAMLGREALAADETTERGPVSSFLDAWFATSDAAKEAQPHWMTPVVTVTPRLEQEYRYDQTWQNRPKSTDITNYGGGKGLELIPTSNTEIIIGEPAYMTRTTPKGSVSGWADETLLVKYRVLSANEEHGNYIVTGFLGVSAPTGNAAFTNNATIVTPTIAAGKGWGTRQAGFDIQSTIGIAIPTADKRTLGMPTVWNTAFQAHILEKLWPEIETTYTNYNGGPNDGKHALAVSAGLVLGRFEITPRVKLIVGGAYQKPLRTFYTYNHTWLLTARAAF